MKKIKILVADDHEIVRRGLRTTLEEQTGWEVVGEAANGRDAVVLARRVHPDVVVMDIAMPEMNGLEATRHIHREVPGARVLILTVHELEEVVREVRGLLGDRVFETVIPRSTKLAESPSFGKPIIHYDKYSASAAAYELLAQEVLARVNSQ